MPTHHFPVFAERTHVPELEQHAINQMPKDNGWTDLKLFRYNDTPLYQWWGRKRTPFSGVGGSPVTYYATPDSCDDPFVIHEIEPDMQGGEDALAIGEHAFRAGFDFCWGVLWGLNDGGVGLDKAAYAQEGWDEYDPPEDIKALS